MKIVVGDPKKKDLYYDYCHDFPFWKILRQKEKTTHTPYR